MLYRRARTADFLHVETFVWQAIFPAFDHEDLNDAQRAANDAVVEEAREICLAAIAHPAREILVAWDEKRRELAGFILLSRETPDFPEIVQLIVARRHWGKGVADELLERGTNWLDGSVPVRVGVIHYLDRAMRFFRRHGFQDSGEGYGEEIIPRVLLVREVGSFPVATDDVMDAIVDKEPEIAIEPQPSFEGLFREATTVTPIRTAEHDFSTDPEVTEEVLTLFSVESKELATEVSVEAAGVPGLEEGTARGASDLLGGVEEGAPPRCMGASDVQFTPRKTALRDLRGEIQPPTSEGEDKLKLPEQVSTEKSCQEPSAPTFDFTAFGTATATPRERPRRNNFSRSFRPPFEFAFGAERTLTEDSEADWDNPFPFEGTLSGAADSLTYEPTVEEEAQADPFPPAAEEDYDRWMAAAAHLSLNELHAAGGTVATEEKIEPNPASDPIPVVENEALSADEEIDFAFGEEPVIELDGSRGRVWEVEWDLSDTSGSEAPDSFFAASASDHPVDRNEGQLEELFAASGDAYTMTEPSIASEGTHHDEKTKGGNYSRNDTSGVKEKPTPETNAGQRWREVPALGELRDQFTDYLTDLCLRLFGPRRSRRLGKAAQNHEFQAIVTASLVNWRSWAGGASERLGRVRLRRHFGELAEFFIVTHLGNAPESPFPERLLRHQGQYGSDIDHFRIFLDYLDLDTEGERYYTDFITMSAKKLRNATTQFLLARPGERIFFLVDQSIMGNLKNGFALTDRAIYWKSLLQPNHAVYFTDLESVSIKQGHLEINGHFFDGGRRLNLRLALLLERLRLS